MRRTAGARGHGETAAGPRRRQRQLEGWRRTDAAVALAQGDVEGDVEADSKDKYGQTHVAGRGYETMVKLLQGPPPQKKRGGISLQRPAPITLFTNSVQISLVAG